MISKAEVKTILSKRLSGEEAGRLWLLDSWEVDRDREGFLSEADIKRLRNNLRTSQDRYDFNKYLELYRELQWLVKDAQITFLKTKYLLEKIINICLVHLNKRIRSNAMSHIPLIVTEKQLQDLKARQKKEKRNKLYCLDQVITFQAYALAPEDFKERNSLEDYITGIEGDEEIPDAVRVFARAKEEIRKLIEIGTLKPVKQDIKASDRQNAGKNNIGDWPPVGLEPWTGVEELLSLCVSGDQLIKAKLPGWEEFVNTFNLWDLPQEEWYGGNPPEGIAIIQETEGPYIDKKGYYIKQFQKINTDLSDFPEDYDSSTSGINESCLKKLITAKEEILTMLSRRRTLQEAAPLVGLNCAEDVDQFYEHLEATIDYYNLIISSLPLSSIPKGNIPGLEDREKESLLNETAYPEVYQFPIRLPLIRLQKLKPKASEVNYCRSILSDTLGSKWWLEAKAMAEEEDLDYGKD